MSDGGKPVVFDHFLSADLYQQLCAIMLDGSLWRYGTKSNRATDEHGHWSWKPVYDHRLNLADISDFMVQLPIVNLVFQQLMGIAALAGHRLIRCYANGYTYGTDGYMHTDSERDDELTAILYVCRSWNRDWGGETVLADDNTAILPSPNRLLVFRSDVLHAARSVSRKCPALRAVLVFKLRPARGHTFEILSRFLVANNALALKHRNSSLHDHLMRCYSLCEGRKLDPDVCLAAGAHSVYGTNAFQQQMLQPDAIGRSKLAGVIGRQGERLVYLFSIIDRPAALTDAVAAGNGYGLRLRYDASIQASRPDYDNLCLIEAANLADQGQLDKHAMLKERWGA